MLEMVIQIEPGKPCTVTGPLNDKVVAYGMLEAARDAIQQYHNRAAEKNAIAIASGIMADRINGAKPSE